MENMMKSTNMAEDNGDVNYSAQIVNLDEASAAELMGNAGLSGQQVIIVASDEVHGEEGVEESLEPLPKRFRFEQGDGKTYVLTVSGDSTTIQEGHCDDALDAGVVNFTTDEQGEDVTQAWFTTKDDKSALHNKGHTWKQGQWLKEEIDLLQHNITLYCKEHNISDPTEIIFEMSKDERKNFYRTVARGLQRPLFSVYRRIIRMYDQRNHIGKYTPEELQRLKELREKHGSDWSTIGGLMGRSASSVKDRCRLMKDTCNSGKWLPDEERRLTNAVFELTGATPGDGEALTSGLSWAAVAEKVATRSEKQCRTKWLNYLNWKHRGGTDWTREDDIALVLKIANSGATDETQIDWGELAKNWSSARSPQWLRGKWWSLKRHVPDYAIVCFTEIVDYLRTMHTQNVRIKAPGSPSGIKVGRVDLQRVPGMQNMTLQIPLSAVTSSHGESVHTSTISTSDDGDSSSFQAFEVLQNLTPATTSQGAYLITQPQSNPAIQFTTANMGGTDHIIVHTLPVGHGNENVTVQMNAPQHVIISSGQDDGLRTHSEETAELHIKEEDAHVLQQHLTDGHISPIKEVQYILDNRMREIPIQDQYEEQAIIEADIVTEGTSVQTHMSSLTDPMLTSDTVDLMCVSDIETVKVQTSDVEQDGSTDIPSS